MSGFLVCRLHVFAMFLVLQGSTSAREEEEVKKKCTPMQYTAKIKQAYSKRTNRETKKQIEKSKYTRAFAVMYVM